MQKVLFAVATIALTTCVGVGQVRTKEEWAALQEETYLRNMVLVEHSISKWKPSRKDRVTPKNSVWAKDANPESTWSTDSNFSVDRIKVHKLSGDTYSVEFSSAGCTSGYSLNRNAIYRNGTLLLDRPLSGLANGIFDRLYTIHHEGKVFLVTPEFIGAKRESRDDESWLWSSAFKKKS